MFRFDGQALATHRLERGFSPTQLAAAIGRTAKAISRYESGEYEPKGSTLLRLSEVLGVPVSDFYQRVGGQDNELVGANEGLG